jgi:hypothetical protein
MTRRRFEGRQNDQDQKVAPEGALCTGTGGEKAHVRSGPAAAEAASGIATAPGR